MNPPRPLVTTTIRKRITEAVDVLNRASDHRIEDDDFPSELEIIGACNKLHHAAVELEAEFLDVFHNIAQGH